MRQFAKVLLILFMLTIWILHPIFILLVDFESVSSIINDSAIGLRITLSLLGFTKAYLIPSVVKLTGQFDDLMSYEKRRLTQRLFSHSLVYFILELFLVVVILVNDADEDYDLSDFIGISAFWALAELSLCLALFLVNLKIFFKYGFESESAAQTFKSKFMGISAILLLTGAVTSIIRARSACDSPILISLYTSWLFSAYLFGNYLLETYRRASTNTPYVNNTSFNSLSKESCHYFCSLIASSILMAAQLEIYSSVKCSSDQEFEPINYLFTTLVNGPIIIISQTLLLYTFYKYFQLIITRLNVLPYQIAQEAQTLENDLVADPDDPDFIAENTEGCPICLEQFTADREKITLKQCKHIFHFNCLRAWVREQHTTCPSCRSAITI